MTAKRYVGQNNATTDQSAFNVMSFIAKQAINLMSTATLVKVTKVSTSGLVAPVGFVSVQPLVNLVDGQGNATPHGVVHKLPYFRLQGGADKAIIMDPKVGDIGMASFADRDISSVKKNKDRSNPGSRRRFNMADGMYFGSFLSGKPTSYLQFKDDGSLVLSPDDGTTFVKIEAGRVEIKSDVIVINGRTYLGGDEASAIRPVSGEGTITSDDASDVSNFLTRVSGT